MRLRMTVLLDRCFFGGQIRGYPTVPAAEKSGRFLDAMSIEVQHRTGACVLLLSSTVGDDLLVRRKLFEARDDLAERHVVRALDVAGIEGFHLELEIPGLDELTCPGGVTTVTT